MQNVSGKLLRVAHILLVVQDHQMVTLMLIEDTLELLCGVLDVLFPLRLEELETFARDNFRVLLLQAFHSCNALVKGRVGPLTCNRNLHWLLARCACHF